MCLANTRTPFVSTVSRTANSPTPIRCHTSCSSGPRSSSCADATSPLRDSPFCSIRSSPSCRAGDREHGHSPAARGDDGEEAAPQVDERRPGFLGLSPKGMATLAGGADHGSACDRCSMASSWLQGVLAKEVAKRTSRTSHNNQGGPRVDPTHGPRESRPAPRW